MNVAAAEYEHCRSNDNDFSHLVLGFVFISATKLVKAECKTKEFILFFAEAHPNFFFPKGEKVSANRRQRLVERK
jgi:hypothetical protein